MTKQNATYAIVPTLVLFWFAIWAFRRLELSLAQPSLEDRAVLEFGEEFDLLPEQERTEVFNQQMREHLLGQALLDEREDELRLCAEGKAYRVMRPGVVLLVAVYWAVCLLGPFAEVRGALALTAIAFTWLALLVLVLPTMIRLWAEPDEVGETRLVTHGRH